MEAVAKLNNVPTSPRKMRLVADLIRGEKVDFALNTLKFDSKVGSKRLEKLLLSAISNWQEKNKDDIFIYFGRKKSKKKIKFINKNNSPFKKLMSLNLK